MGRDCKVQLPRHQADHQRFSHAPEVYPTYGAISGFMGPVREQEGKVEQAVVGDQRRAGILGEEREGEPLLFPDDRAKLITQNKEEVQINTLFFDVYQMTRPYPGPKPFFFVMKRSEYSFSLSI